MKEGKISAMVDTTIRAENVTKVFAETIVAVKDASFDISNNEFISIVGPSGCGKSTLLRLVAGLIPTNEGNLSINGTAVTEPRSDVALMFQKATLLAWKNAMENVLIPTSIANGKITDADRRTAIELLQLTGLSGFEFTYPDQLSGGMQQRVALARLLNTGSKILLLDEPFGALDEFTRETMNLELLRIVNEVQATTLFVTHNISEAIFLADRVFVMTPRPGRLAAIVDVPLGKNRTPEIAQSLEFNRIVSEVRHILGENK